MNAKSIRNTIFYFHRYLGLAIALAVITIGLTGSLLVFRNEIAHVDREARFGRIVPQEQVLPVEKIIAAVEPIYADRSDAKLLAFYFPHKPNEPANVAYSTKDKDWVDNYVDPYTGKFITNTLQSALVPNAIEWTLKFHHELLAGEIGSKIAGIVGLLMSILTLTGVALWPGWRKLSTGFKIKWDAHPKRLNFDLHKVVGMVAMVFLLFTFFTGFCWNFDRVANPVIHAITFSPQKLEPVSTVITGKTSRPLSDLIQTARSTLPGAKLQTIYFPSEPTGTISFRYKLPQEPGVDGHSYVYLDRYNGKVLRVDNGLKPSLGDRLLNSFVSLHYGLFWGLPSRIFYIFVGLAPLCLATTGFIMWRYRRRKTTPSLEVSRSSHSGDLSL